MKKAKTSPRRRRSDDDTLRPGHDFSGAERGVTAARYAAGSNIVKTKDPYLDVVAEHWQKILTLYVAFQDKRPVMLFDTQEGRIYAYPYAEFKADLSKWSQGLLERQYQEAKREDKIVVFVRDNAKKRLVSYCLA